MGMCMGAADRGASETVRERDRRTSATRAHDAELPKRILSEGRGIIVPICRYLRYTGRPYAEQK